MANIGAPLQKSLIDWSTRGATPVQPAACYAGLAGGTPTSVSFSEIATTLNYARATCGFAAAVTTAGNVGSASLATAMTFGTFNASQAVSGIFIADSVSSNAGTMVWFANLATARTPLSGDSLVFAVGALNITLS
jgi:hypothetical protein